MDMDDLEDEVKADAGASDTVPIKAGDVRVGSYLVIKDHPCKVVEWSSAKTGKHGHAKANITGLDIFTGNKYSDSCPTSHSMTAPVVKSEEWQAQDVNEDGYLTLMSEGGETREDMKLPPDQDLARQISEAVATFNSKGNPEVWVTITKAMGTEQVMAIKTKNS